MKEYKKVEDRTLEVQEPFVEYRHCTEMVNVKSEPVAAGFNQAQLQFLRLLSFIKTEETLRELQQIVSDFYMQKLQKEADRYWEEGKIGAYLLNEHLRTPYK